MKENILIDKSIDFGARIVKLHRYLLSAPGYFVIQKALYFVILRQLAQVRGYKQRDYITICTTNLGLSNR